MVMVGELLGRNYTSAAVKRSPGPISGPPFFFRTPIRLSRYNDPRPTWIRELTRERIAHAACCHNPPPVSEPRSRRSGRGGLSGLAVGPGLGTDGIGRTLDRVHDRPRREVPAAETGRQGGLVNPARAGNHGIGGHGTAPIGTGSSGRPHGDPCLQVP